MVKKKINITLLKRFSRRFETALKILSSVFGEDKKIIAKVNEKLPEELFLDPSECSKLRRGHKKNSTEYFNRNSEARFRQLFTIVDLLVKEHTEKVWDDTRKMYIQLEKNFLTDIEKVNELKGTWRAYTLFKKSKNGDNKIYVFTIAIQGSRNIVCRTNKSDFTNNKVSFLDSKLIVDLFDEKNKRKVSLITNIGQPVKGDLKDKSDFVFVYIDTGLPRPSGGIIVIERVLKDSSINSKPTIINLADLKNSPLYKNLELLQHSLIMI